MTPEGLVLVFVDDEDKWMTRQGTAAPGQGSCEEFKTSRPETAELAKEASSVSEGK